MVGLAVPFGASMLVGWRDDRRDWPHIRSPGWGRNTSMSDDQPKNRMDSALYSCFGVLIAVAGLGLLGEAFFEGGVAFVMLGIVAAAALCVLGGWITVTNVRQFRAASRDPAQRRRAMPRTAEFSGHAAEESPTGKHIDITDYVRARLVVERLIPLSWIVVVLVWLLLTLKYTIFASNPGPTSGATLDWCIGGSVLVLPLLARRAQWTDRWGRRAIVCLALMATLLLAPGAPASLIVCALFVSPILRLSDLAAFASSFPDDGFRGAMRKPRSDRVVGAFRRARRGRHTRVLACAVLVAGAAGAGLILWKWPYAWRWSAIVGGVVVFGFIELLKRARRQELATAEEVLRVDRRPPVLYLRSFEDDARAIPRSFFGSIFRPSDRLEEILVRGLARAGPVIAIGNPGEPLPETGASREYHDDEYWEAAVVDRMKQSQLICYVFGRTRAVAWEFEQILSLEKQRRLLIVFPAGHVSARCTRWAAFVENVDGLDIADTFRRFDPSAALVAVLDADETIVAIYSERTNRRDYEIALAYGMSLVQSPRDGEVAR
jgi:hypothetical protein